MMIPAAPRVGLAVAFPVAPAMPWHTAAHRISMLAGYLLAGGVVLATVIAAIAMSSSNQTRRTPVAVNSQLPGWRRPTRDESIDRSASTKRGEAPRTNSFNTPAGQQGFPSNGFREPAGDFGSKSGGITKAPPPVARVRNTEAEGTFGSGNASPLENASTQESAPPLEGASPQEGASPRRGASPTPTKTTWGTGGLFIRFENDDDVTFGPIGCPVVVVAGDIWDVEQKKIVQRINPKEIDQLRVLSADGKWFAAVLRDSTRSRKTVRVWSTVIGEPVFDIPDAAGSSYVRFLDFSRSEHLLVWGGNANEMRVFDLATAEEMAPIRTSERIDPAITAFSPTGDYFTQLFDYRLNVVSTKSQKPVAVMEAPPVLDAESLDENQRRLRQRSIMGNSEFVRFSPDGQELAMVTNEPRLLCWDSKGQLVFDQLIYRARHDFAFRPSFRWLPDASGWIVSGYIVDREEQRIVAHFANEFARFPFCVALDRNRVIARLKGEKTLKSTSIPWDQIESSLAALKEGRPAVLSPSAPVSIKIELVGLGPNASQGVAVLEEQIARRLAFDGIRTAPDCTTVFRLRLKKSVSQGRTKTSVIAELVTEDKIWWQEEPVNLYGEVRELFDGRTIDDRVVASIFRHVSQLDFPYFIPESPQLSVLPLVVE